jgi:predicted lipoprotein with Yx(FWY)xxD motif
MNMVRGLLRLSIVVGAALLLTFAARPLPAWAASSAAPTVMVVQHPTLGGILTDAKGMTLYTFKKDKPGESVCVDTCAKNWPPMAVAEGMQPMAGPGIAGKLGQIERKDDTYQVTYNGMPLYYFAKDTKPGDVNGQNMGGVWFVVPTSAAPPTASSQAPKSY